MKRKSTKQDVYADLRRRIISMDLPLGADLDEVELVDHYGVSRTPIRETLIRLQGEGLVELRRNRGAYVAPLDFPTLKAYFDGLYYSDTERLGRVFHPRARYVSATGEDLVDLGMDEYFPVVDKREPPATRGEERRDAIQSIQFAGPKTAFACVNCGIGDRYFTDFLTLIKTDDGWRIIAKVFHYDIV